MKRSDSVGNFNNEEIIKPMSYFSEDDKEQVQFNFDIEEDDDDDEIDLNSLNNATQFNFDDDDDDEIDLST